jgi:hypothetical protein
MSPGDEHGDYHFEVPRFCSVVDQATVIKLGHRIDGNVPRFFADNRGPLAEKIVCSEQSAVIR